MLELVTPGCWPGLQGLSTCHPFLWICEWDLSFPPVRDKLGELGLQSWGTSYNLKKKKRKPGTPFLMSRSHEDPKSCTVAFNQGQSLLPVLPVLSCSNPRRHRKRREFPTQWLSVVCVCERERVYSHGTDRENTSTNKLSSTSWWQKHGLDPRQLWTGNPVDRVATDRVMGQSVLAQGAMESGFPEWRMWGQIWKEGEKWNWREERSESTRTQGLAFAQW